MVNMNWQRLEEEIHFNSTTIYSTFHAPDFQVGIGGGTSWSCPQDGTNISLVFLPFHIGENEK